MVDSGKSDKIQVVEESSFGAGTGTNVVFGYSSSVEYNVDSHTKQIYGLESEGSNPVVNSDGVIEVIGSHDWFVNDGRELKAWFGGLTDDNVSSFTLSLADDIPSYAIDTVLDGSTFKKIVGVKYGKLSFSVERGDDPVMISAGFVARDVEDSVSFTPQEPVTNPFRYFDGKIVLGGSELADVEKITLELDRKAVGRRFIKDVVAGEKRLITNIVLGVTTITFSGVATARASIIDDLQGDYRSDTTMSLLLSNSTNTLQLDLTGVRLVTGKRVLNKESEVVTVEFTGVAKGITGSGTY